MPTNPALETLETLAELQAVLDDGNELAALPIDQLLQRRRSREAKKLLQGNQEPSLADDSLCFVQ